MCTEPLHARYFVICSAYWLCFYSRNVFNVLPKRNPFERLIVEGRCTDCRLDDRLGYRWKLSLLSLQMDESLDDSWKELTDLEDYTATGLSSSSLVIEPGLLRTERKYRLQLNAWRPGGEPGGYVIEELFTNAAPKSGSCDVPIKEGVALQTEFTVKCEGWIDDDKPLSYLIGNNSVSTINVSKGSLLL